MLQNENPLPVHRKLYTADSSETKKNRFFIFTLSLNIDIILFYRLLLEFSSFHYFETKKMYALIKLEKLVKRSKETFNLEN